jgi:hypothetical protein
METRPIETCSYCNKPSNDYCFRGVATLGDFYFCKECTDIKNMGDMLMEIVARRKEKQ